MKLIVNGSSMVPIYEQVMEQIKALILNGSLKENDVLPSVRTLAKELKISALTVKKAYDYLEQEGFTVTVHGKGTYVAAANREMMLEEQRKELQACIAEERLAKPKMKEEFVRFWLLRFRKLDMTQPEQRQALVDTFINAIYLYDDKVLITFNYKEGTETVAFGEAVKAEKSSDMSARGAPNFERQIVRFGVLSLCH